MNKKGFSLIELLAVLVILALIAIVVSGLVSNTVDKAKVSITKAQEKAILNAAEKWSVDNSNEFDDVEGKTIQLGLDVVFILDISTSMTTVIPGSPIIDGFRTRRFYAMVDSINLAMGILEDPNNRQAVFMFGGSFYTFMPLGTYSSASKEYIKMENGNAYYAQNKFITSADLKKDGVSYSNSEEFHGGTKTQEGIIKGTQILLDTTPSEASGRIPVVILLTDGEPYGVNKGLCESCNASAQSNTGLEDSYYYALMAGYERSAELREHYYGSPVYFYTIGFGISNSESVRKLLNPSSYAETSQYNYVTKAFIDQNMSADELRLIFEEISTAVVEATKVTQVCVTLQDLHEQGYLNDKDIDLEAGELSENYVMINYNEATNQFNFSLAKTEAQKNACKSLLQN